MVASTSYPFMNSSEMPDDSDHRTEFAYAERVVLAVAISFIAVFGSVGNGLVIVSVALSRKLRTATNVYVVSLSATDLLTCLCLPWHALAVVSVEGWPMDMVVCSGCRCLIYHLRWFEHGDSCIHCLESAVPYNQTQYTVP